MTRGADIKAEESGANEIGLRDWQAVGFSLIGMFIFLQGLTGLFGLLGLKMLLSGTNVGCFSEQWR